MFCKNCGTEINTNERFCGKCGTPIENIRDAPIALNLKPKSKRNSIIVTFVIVALVIGVIGVIVSNSGKLYGQWEVSEKSSSELFSDYPEDDFIIYDNGTFTADGMSGTYSTSGKTITFSFSFWGSYTYKYDVSGDVLTLQLLDESDDEPKIYYDRVD